MTRRSFLLGLTIAAGAGCRTALNTRNHSLRVLSYNVHHGEGTDGLINLERIARIIVESQADLVALQEVDRNARRTGVVDQPAEYARLTGLHGWFGAAMPFQGGEYGQVLLSRWPMIDPRVVRLPGASDHEPRIAVTALIDVPKLGRIRWAGVHLDASRTDEDRWEQAGALAREFAANSVPTLLAGDFNAVPESRVMRRLLGGDGDWMDIAADHPEPTIPSDNPRSRIDYILARPAAAWRPLQTHVLPESVASDHRPLYAELELVTRTSARRASRSKDQGRAKAMT